jgi:POT family proton-dependent oligopeptide transporter
MVLGLAVYLVNQDKIRHEPAPAASTTPIVAIAAFAIGIPAGIVALLWLLTLPPIVPLALALAALASGVAWTIRLPPGDRPRVIAICAACIVTAGFWAVYEQQGNTLQLWADQNTHWPTILGFTIPSTWYQTFNPFMIWILVPLLNLLWAWQGRRGSEPTSLAKMAIGCVILGAGFIVMIVAAIDMPAGPRSSVLWLVASTAIYTVGELYLSPVGLSFVSKVAPARMASMMMGVWYLSNFVGNYMTGYLGTYYERIPHTHFFLLMAAIGAGAGLALFVMNRLLDRIVGTRDRQAVAGGAIVARA